MSHVLPSHPRNSALIVTLPHKGRCRLRAFYTLAAFLRVFAAVVIE